MTKVLTVDQSLGKSAYTLWENGKPLDSGIWKSGNSAVKKKFNSVTYFDTTEEQIHFLCDHLNKYACRHQVEVVVFEALSFGSTGNATRDLACLYGAMVERLFTTAGIVVEDMHKVAPMTLKTFARDLLPEDKQFDGMTKANKPKKVKMDKKLMIEAANLAGGEPFLEGLKMTGENSGLDDAADSFLLGKYYYEKLK